MTPTIGPQFGPQFPAILDKEIQSETIIPFDFNDIREVHFGRNGASDGARNQIIFIIKSIIYLSSW